MQDYYSILRLLRNWFRINFHCCSCDYRIEILVINLTKADTQRSSLCIIVLLSWRAWTGWYVFLSRWSL